MTDTGPSVPPIISHYRLVRKLGSGGMGQVFEGVDRRDDSPVAVKLMWPHLAQDQSFQARFRKEAHVASLLHSPYTVKLLDFGLQAGWNYLVMEFVKGEPLGARLRRGPVPPREAALIALDVARALEEAEARGVVHRDLKPDNILITREGMAKVADFGIARDSAGGSGTVTGSFVGSALYAAPEQFRGGAEHRSDQYSLGATLYHMVTGRPPFEGDLFDLFQSHANAPVPMAPLTAVPEALGAVIIRCLAKDPAERFESAAQLVRALTQALLLLTPSPGDAATVVLPKAAPSASTLPLSLPDPPPSAGAAPMERTLVDAVTRTAADPGVGGAGEQGVRSPDGAATAFRSPWPAASAVLTAFVLFAIASFVSAALAHWQLQLGPYAKFVDLGARYDARQTAIGVQTVIAVASLPLLAWFGRRYVTNLATMGGGRTPRGGQAATWGWLVPVGNVLIPFVALVRQLWEQPPGVGSKRRFELAFVLGWWAVSVAGLIMWIAAVAMETDPREVLSARPGTVRAIRTLQSLTAVMALTAAGWVAALVHHQSRSPHGD